MTSRVPTKRSAFPAREQPCTRLLCRCCAHNHLPCRTWPARGAAPHILCDPRRHRERPRPNPAARQGSQKRLRRLPAEAARLKLVPLSWSCRLLCLSTSTIILWNTVSFYVSLLGNANV